MGRSGEITHLGVESVYEEEVVAHADLCVSRIDREGVLANDIVLEELVEMHLLALPLGVHAEDHVVQPRD